MVDTIYFGRPGAQITLPAALGGITAPRSRQSQTFATGSGSARVSRTIDGRRKITLNWTRLFRSDYEAIEAYWHGHNGSGPWSYIDPTRRNLLTPNQSGATSLRNDTEGFSASGDMVLGSTSSTVNRGPRSLSIAGVGSASIDPPAPVWPGIPVVPGVALVFSYYGNNISNSVAKLVWLDDDGTELSTTSSAPGGGASWVRNYVTGTPPAGAAFVRPQWLVNAFSFGLTGHMDQFQLEMGSTPTDWRPGTGLYPISIESLGDGWPWNASEFVDRPVLVLQEVG